MFSKITRPLDMDPKALIRAPGQAVVTTSGDYGGDWVDFSLFNQAYWHPGNESGAKIITIGVHVEAVTFVGGSLIMLTSLGDESDGSGYTFSGGRLDVVAPGFYESTFNTHDLIDRASAAGGDDVALRYANIRAILGAGNSIQYSAWVSQVLPA